MREITIDEPIYKRMKFVDMRDVSEELQWKVLEYHNQKFVLDGIYGKAFTKEDHAKFLASLVTTSRKHYIVYFDDRPVGKYSFDIEGDAVTNIGTYLFHEEDVRTGMGLLLDLFFKKYVFHMMGKSSIKFSVKKENRKQISFMKKTCGIVVYDDEDALYFEVNQGQFCNKEIYFNSLLNAIFA